MVALSARFPHYHLLLVYICVQLWLNLGITDYLGAVKPPLLQEHDILFSALVHHLVWPKAGLDLADMRLPQIKHAQA